MECILRTEYLDAESRLHELGFSSQELRAVVDEAAAAARGCTQNDAPMAEGMLAYLHGTRHVRQIKRQQPGWEMSNAGNFCSVFNAALGVRVVVVNTDEGTGTKEAIPRNRAEKGIASEGATDSNLVLFPDLPRVYKPVTLTTVSRLPARPAGLATWYLCMFVSSSEVRAELSLPIEMEDGFFKRFGERIFLIDRNGPVTTETSADADGDVEVEISRRA